MSSANAPASRIPKPQLRELHVAGLRKHIVGMFLFGSAAAYIYHLMTNVANHNRIEAFYKTYDPEAKLAIMNEAGLMQSCPQDDD